MPNEWSNLEDLVTHLQDNASNQPVAKTTFADQSASQPTAKAAPEQVSQSTRLKKPASVTVQRKIASPPSKTKATIIQACQDTSSNVVSANANEQTEDSHSYSQYVELLAQEVYGLLRQRLSLEQERRGPKYPR